MRNLAWQGALLFAFIPLVLFLYLQQPIGPGLSVAAGVTVMLGHRFLASPWMERHALERCLWCGRSISLDGGAVEVTASRRRWTLRTCGDGHRARIGRFFTFVARFRLAIALGIFLPLFILLAGTLLIAAGRPVIPPEWNRLQFRSLVAVTVVGTSMGYLGVRKADQVLMCPFPLHNLFLLGVGNTLWVFRIVGVWWLALGLAALAAD